MKVIDLAHAICKGMPVYPGTERPKLDIANIYEHSASLKRGLYEKE